MKTAMSWQYIAGFVDGEGSIVQTQKRVYRLLIPQTHEGVLQEIRHFVAAGTIYKVKKRQAHWKDSWTFAVARQEDLLRFLKKIIPHLIVKKSLAVHRVAIIEKIVAENRAKRRYLQKKLKLCKLLRSQGMTYRAIAKRMNIDFGYARRLYLFAQEGVWRN